MHFYNIGDGGGDGDDDGSASPIGQTTTERNTAPCFYFYFSPSRLFKQQGQLLHASHQVTTIYTTITSYRENQNYKKY